MITRRFAPLSVAFVVALAGGGCGETISVAPNLAAAPAVAPRRIDDRLTRHATVAEGVSIHATLWEPGLVASTMLDETTPGPKAEQVPRWVETYLARTSFTVVVELEQRRPELAEEAILDLASWGFGLERDNAEAVESSEVRLLLVDRFGARGGPHHRLVFSVHFDGTLHDYAASLAETGDLTLRVRLSLPKRMGQSPMGSLIPTHGAPLRWRVAAG